jgi:co-chaperonin GroES (HSP10)
MAKHFIMGEGKLTEEERKELEQQKIDREAKEKEWLTQQKQREAEKKEVTLSELLATTLEPQEDRIVVWRDKAERFTEGGLLKPDEVLQKERPSRGTVIAVGPGKVVDDVAINNYIQAKILHGMEVVHGKDLGFKTLREDIQTMVKPNYKPGDRIMFGRFAGTPIDDPETGEELLIMRPSDIFVKL